MDLSKFWNYVNKDSVTGCWNWTRGKVWSGYGYFYLPGPERIQVRAHREAWELTNGPIPAGLFVLHRCDNPLCCNPAHLFLGTQTDNMRDMDKKGRRKLSHNFSKRDQNGENNCRAKLTAENVREIRRLIKSHTHEALAKKFGVSRGDISLISENKIWKEV